MTDRARGTRDAFSLPHSHFWCDTIDGIRLSGTRLGEEPDTAVVVAHGFLGYRTKPKWRILSEALAEHFTVLTFDLRGHGQSGGACTGGEDEAMDVHAVVQYARLRGFRHVVTVGGSLGGIAVIREAARYNDPDAVVAISTPARWDPNGSRAVRRATWLFTSPTGRSIARRVMGTRIAVRWQAPEAPVDIVGKIAPVPVLIVHGEDDHFFTPAAAEALHAAAGDPSHLWLVPRFGHAEDGFTAAFGHELAARIAHMLATSPAR